MSKTHKFGYQGDAVLIHLRDNVYYERKQYPSSRGKFVRKYWILSQCSICNNEFFRDYSNSLSGSPGYCSKECKSVGMSGQNNVNWGGGTKNKRGKNGGHILEYCPSHPAAKNGFVPQHRRVIEEHIGRILLDTEVVHHIDCDMQNNYIENLVVCSSTTEHFLAHGSLNKCVKSLMSIGCLIFNRETMMYEVVDDYYK